MPKHSPGPWEANLHDDEKRLIAIQKTEKPFGDVLLCTGDDESAWGNVSPEDLDLICAAPELLASCREQAKLIEGLRNLLTFYRIGKRPSEKVLDSVQGASEVQGRATAAIAKAEGRDS